MPCKSCTASYHNTSQHIQPYPHSQELFQTVSFLPALITPNHTRLFAFLLLGVCSGFAFACAVVFSNFVFLTFLPFGGTFGNSGFVHFYLLFLILRFSGFSPFSRISRSSCFLDLSIFEKVSICLVFVLSASSPQVCWTTFYISEPSDQ